MKKKSKKKTDPSSKKRATRRLRTTEAVCFLVILISLYALLSLISYSGQDPSWTSTPLPNQRIQNFGGKVGAYLSEGLFQFFGLAAFLVPLVLGYMSLKTLLPPASRRTLTRWGGGLFLLTLFPALFSLLFHRFSWRSGDFLAGGLFGDLLSSFLVRYFNQAGSLIFLVALLLLFIIFSTEFSLTRFIIFVSRSMSFAFKEVRIRVSHYQKSRAREKMRQKVIQKYTSAPEKSLSSPPVSPAAKGVTPDQKKESRKELKKGTKPEPILIHPPSPRPAEKLLFPEMEKAGDYTFPPLTLLDPGTPSERIDKSELYEKKKRIEEKLAEFRVEGEVKEYHPGPVITTYEFYPNPGIKVSQVASLSEDLSLALGAESVRIQRIPGRSSLGVEIPNNKREIIKLRDIIQSEKFMNSPSKLTFALGKTIHGEVYITDLSIMPHLLIAGATGTGKSVALNALIASILYKATPDEVKMILIDPKRLEFTLYDGIPHLLTPVINDPKKAGGILMDAVKKMEERYHRLSFFKVRDIEQYNQLVSRIRKEKRGKLTEEEREKLKPLPYMVIIIDELAELMMIGAQEVEYCIARLAQLARAVGIHLVMATQRPSIDVITGTIKNNFSSRIAFRVPSKVDSRIIIDTAGAEKLLGLGDMLFMPPNYPRLIRLHCAYISIPEVTRLVKFVKEQRPPEFDEKLVKFIKSPVDQEWEDTGEKDELYEKAVELVLLTGQASASYLQRKLKLGYARAARIIDQMEREGILGPSEGSKPREILVDPQSYLAKKTKES